MKITKANLKRELKHLQLMVLQYSSDRAFLKILYSEIARVQDELKYFDKSRNS